MKRSAAQSAAMTALGTVCLVTATAVLLLIGPTRLYAEAVRSIRVVLPPQRGPVADRAAKSSPVRSTQRCQAKVSTSGEANLRVELALEPEDWRRGLPNCRWPGRLDPHRGQRPAGVTLRRGQVPPQQPVRPGRFHARAWRGDSVPACPLRGVYFATHFNNYYEAASREEIQQYIEDLSLWGTNFLMLHFPHWQYAGYDDPAARKMIERLRRSSGPPSGLA